MKRLVTLLMLTLLLLGMTACATPKVKGVVDNDERVSSFLSLFPEAEYLETSYSGDSLLAFKDVIIQDCGAFELPDELVRATYVAKAATMIAYVDPTTSEIRCVASKLNQEAFVVENGDPSTVEEGTLVTVNGDPITQDDANAVIASLSEEVRAKTTAKAIVNQLIDQRLLQQKAATIDVDDILDERAEQLWTDAGFESKEAFTASLTEQGSSYALFEDALRKQLRVERLLEQEGVTDVNVSEEDARSFYLQNTNSFLVSEQVRFRQLFISFNKSGSKDAAAARLRNVLQQLNQSLDLCEAIKRYSDDESSKDRCGEYVAARGVLTPEIENAIFALDVNQSTLTESAGGFHFFIVLEKQPTTVIPYAQAETQVRGLLRNQVVQQRLNLYALKLRADAEIITYT